MKCSTQLMIKYDFDIEINFKKSIWEKIDIEIMNYSKYIKFVTLSINSKNEKEENTFEVHRNKFILLLKSMNIYTSVLYDSISAKRHKFISDSIYELERNFRNLIELVFLNEEDKNLTELPMYKRIDVKSKKENREEVVQALQNPLDDLDFIKLSEFVGENITLDNKRIIIEQLNELMEQINTFQNKSDKSEIMIENIEKDIEEIKGKLISKNKKDYSASKIFNHLTNKISTEWKELYKIRNLWAHNNCIITKEEFNRYKRLSKNVEQKLYTELTLLTFFNEDINTNIIVKDNNIELAIKKFDIHGRENCKLEFIVNREGKSLILEKDLFIYKDFDKWFEILDCQDLIELNKNPIMLFNKNSNEIEIFKNKIKEIKTEEIEILKKEMKDIKINEILGNASEMSKEISESLEEIFGEK